MAKPSSPTRLVKLSFQESDTHMVVDLPKLFNVNSLDFATAEAVGFEIVDKIVDRTGDKENVLGSPLKSYSKEYTESDDFRAFGKQAGSANMRLTGQMLGTLTVLGVEDNGKVKIGWDDSEENAKAFNHNTGETVPQRWFLGLTAKELSDIKANNANLVQDLDPEEPQQGQGESLLSLADIISFIGGS
jgi:hypothetical protein